MGFKLAWAMIELESASPMMMDLVLAMDFESVWVTALWNPFLLGYIMHCAVCLALVSLSCGGMGTALIMTIELESVLPMTTDLNSATDFESVLATAPRKPILYVDIILLGAAEHFC
jgi:hypothetical protein